LRRVVNKLLQGEHIHVTTIGGSVTAGLHGIGDGHSWPDYLFNYLNDTFPGQVTSTNGAVPGTISSYMSACVNIHVPKETDIVLVEYSVNDPYNAGPLFANEYRRSYERLLRKLLVYPHEPAVILMHSYNWMAPPHGNFWTNLEREYNEFAWFYDLPALSLKACCYHEMRKGLDGFFVEEYRSLDVKRLAYKSFFFDKIHPDALTGSRAMAELAMHLIQRVLHDLKLHPLQPGTSSPSGDSSKGEGEGDSTHEEESSGGGGGAGVQPVIPDPMIPGNFQPLNDKCFIGRLFQGTIVTADGFEWLNDSRGRSPKFGYISKRPGSVLRMKINTMASAGLVTDSSQLAKKLKPAEARLSTKVLVQIVHLKSYEGMGIGVMQCESGCTCDRDNINGHHPDFRNSQLYLHEVYVTQSESCVISITVARTTDSGKFKVKIAGVIISEEPGEVKGPSTAVGAVEMVSTISMRKDGTTFDVRNKPKP